MSTTLKNDVMDYAPYTRTMARKYTVPGYTVEDLEQEGFEALLKADWSKSNGNNNSYAYLLIRSKLHRLWLDSNRTNKLSLNSAYSLDFFSTSFDYYSAEHDCMALNDVVASNGVDPLEIVLAKETVDIRLRLLKYRNTVKTNLVEPMMDDRGCWEWVGFVSKAGSMLMDNEEGKTVSAIKYLYEAYTGIKLGEGKRLVGNTCKNKTCVNPSHRINRALPKR